jgi:hypothetical protein
LVADLKDRHDIDFLYADPNEQSRALLRGTQFTVFGTLRRYVLPIGDRRPSIDVGIRVGHLLFRVGTSRMRRASFVPRPAALVNPEPFWTPPGRSDRLVAYHDSSLYRARLPGYPSDQDWWLTVHAEGVAQPPDGALLIRGPSDDGVATLYTPPRGFGHRLAPFLPALIAELRRRGCRRLQVTTVAESSFRSDLRRCGFVPRNETIPLLGLGLTALGDECLRAVQEWEITDLECDR